jgi:hypothetical protein
VGRRLMKGIRRGASRGEQGKPSDHTTGQTPIKGAGKREASNYSTILSKSLPEEQDVAK